MAIPSVPPRPTLAASLLSDIHPVMAKVHSSSGRSGDTALFHARLGACIGDVQRAFRLSLEEFAHALGKDDRQVARWMSGEVRPQLETVLAVERFRAPLLIALAGLAPEITIETTLTFRRTA